MNATARRQFLKAGTSLAVLGALPRAVQAAMGPNDKYDLLIRNANVLDRARASPASATSASATARSRRSRRRSPPSADRA